jgi:hypothetical protein
MSTVTSNQTNIQGGEWLIRESEAAHSFIPTSAD